MSEHAKDSFPYQAVADVSRLCRTDSRVHVDAEERAVVQVIREHVGSMADRHRIDPNVLARVSASMMEPTSLSAEWYLKAADDPEGDFAKTARRMGYKNTVMATTVSEDRPRVEVALVRSGRGDTPWFVVEHIDCHPDGDGESNRDDFPDFAQAVTMFESIVERHRVKPGMMM